MRTLVIGGARSGKSRAAEAALADRPDVTYVATGYPVTGQADAEWAARVARHVADRPSTWRTLETVDLVAVLTSPGGPLLVDCLTLWLTRVMDEAGAWTAPPGSAVSVDGQVDAQMNALVDAVAGCARELVLVTNEVGQGVVPATESGRRFRDEMGRLNTAVAAACDDVLWCVAGRVVRL